MILEQPKLLNGRYRLSLWFGDERWDFFEAEDCMTFEIVNMAGTKQLPSMSVGSTAPVCRWEFD
jgi:hypothetical protein